jgi:beta-ureidopropionase / N-carbamoyl-L-amino-acid hydrolase
MRFECIASTNCIADAVDGRRLWSRHIELARHGGSFGAAIDRQALSIADAKAHCQVIDWGNSIGLAASLDPVGNLFLRREGRDPTLPPILVGSHLDSQPTGGPFDGSYGVLAGLEALQAIHEAGVMHRHPIEVVAWCNEEGCRFAPGMMGSAAFVGGISIKTALEARDIEGRSFGEALSEFHRLVGAVPSRPLGAPTAAYVEAHIEQGPVLEENNCAIGIVAGIQGAAGFEVDIVGTEAHAGTTPFLRRRDTVKHASSLIAAITSLAERDPALARVTVGRVQVWPNSPNTIGGRTTFSIDLRHPDDPVRGLLASEIERICNATGGECLTSIRRTFDFPTTCFDQSCIDVIEETANALGLTAMRLQSGAFHDAKNLALVCPTAMLFIPSRAGSSHNPKEFSEPAHVEAGAKILACTLAKLAC